MATPFLLTKVQGFYIFITIPVCLKFTRVTFCWRREQIPESEEEEEEERTSCHEDYQQKTPSSAQKALSDNMPSRKKASLFASAFVSCVCSFGMVCVVLATQQWMSSQLRFSNSTVSLTYGLFSGTCEQFVDPGLQVSEKAFQVAGSLGSTKAKSMITAIIVILVLSLLSSLLSSGFTCTNAVSNPYQTFLGPIGVYTWNSLCGIFTLLAMILFPVNVEGHELSVELARGCFPFLQTHVESAHTYGYSYWLMLLILLLNIISAFIIYIYDHARYSKKKEQERPIQNAPKDVILF